MLKAIFKDKKALILSGLFVLEVAAFSVPAYAQNDMNDKLSRLENEIETLSRAVYTGRMPQQRSIEIERTQTNNMANNPRMQANSEIRLQQLETELRSLRGMIEQQSFEMRQLDKKLNAALGDMQVQISDLGAETQQPAQQQSPQMQTQGQENQRQNSLQAYNANAPQSLTNPKPPIKPENPANSTQNGMARSLQDIRKSQEATQQLPDPEATTQYETAFSFLKNDKYDQAEQGFETFIQMHPGHALVPNAKYWLGESFYVRGDFERASRIFAEGYQRYPQSAKAPDNLLKLGMSLVGLGSEEDACVAFKQLRKDFATNAQAVVRRAEQEMTKISCGV